MSTLLVKDGDGNQVYLQVGGAGTITDPYISVSEPISTQLALGNVYGRTNGRKFGRNIALTTSERVVSVGSTSAIPYFPTAAQAVEVISSDANDITGGTGATKIFVTGLDGSWNTVTETVAMNGTGVQALANTYLRINSAYVTETGTYSGTNVGTITLRVGGAGTTFVQIAIGKGQTQTTAYAVSAGHTLLVNDVHFNVETTKTVSFEFKQITGRNDVTTPYGGALRIVQDYDGMVAPIEFDYSTHPFIFEEYTDIYFTGTAAASATIASIEYSLMLIEN